MSHKNLILSLNAGSSSLKISLYALREGKAESDEEPVQLLLTSSVSGISAPPAKFSFKPSSGNAQSVKDENIESIHDHASAFAHFLERLEKDASIDRNAIQYICHRVVHGGDYVEPVEITNESYHHIEKLSDLAPLHNGSALSVIKSCIEALPKSKSIAYFDTTFHTSIPVHISSYAIDPEIAKKRGLKKYGFHGLSYAFILGAVSKFLNKPTESLNLIILHLGSGASACAIRAGKSFDTSMGLTPLHGLPGATRSGTIDPSLIFHYTNKAGRITHDPGMASDIHVTQAEDILNRKAGWKALCGTTDFGIISDKAELDKDDQNGHISKTNLNRLAFDLFVDRILGYVGSYHLKLGGEVDALVFSGGIGERSVALRDRIGEKIRCLGYQDVDRDRNGKVAASDGAVSEISTGVSRRKILVVKTDEQLEMTRECVSDKKLWA
ncbi:Acetokinase family-domain-containing protein [Crepidotus variabilis]|uniref:Probable acetate kinase n=1 Tax=Crepidotus variabilis TaxID=179855 RepID=A0A9P6ERC9_9AGAR|nr:Acetokinase family-domain-containing protein [Crepidotus variabilis]